MHELKNLQDLPEEISVEIFSYLPLTEVGPLYTECLLFQNTVTRLVVGGVKNLSRRITHEIRDVKKEMQSSSAITDSCRLDYSTVLTYLRCMLTEAALLRATVGHYVNNETSLVLLIDPLCQILQEFYSNFTILKDSSVRKVIRADYSSPGTAHWNAFFKTFDSTFRPNLEEASGIIIPMEVTIVDLLHCSVSSNLQTNFSCLYQEDKYALNMFFQLKDIGHNGTPPNFNNGNWNQIEKQNRLIKYLRSLIRYENRAFVCKHVRELNDLENLIVLSGANIVLDDVFEKLQKKYSEITFSPFKTISRFLSPTSSDTNLYNEVYYRAIDWDVTETGVIITFKMVSDKKYLPMDYNYRIFEQLYLSRKESEDSLQREVSDTMLGTRVSLSEVPRIDHGLRMLTSRSDEFSDVNINVRYDTSFFRSIPEEIEISYNKNNSNVSFTYDVFDHVTSSVVYDVN